MTPGTSQHGRSEDLPIPWAKRTAPDRLPPRECIRNAYLALNKAYSEQYITDGRKAFGFVAEAVDWQRRALEQMVGDDHA